MFNQIEMGQRIKEERKRLSLSLDAFADQVSVSRQTLAKWEKGAGAGPAVVDLMKMANLFRCDFAYLIGEQPERHRAATDVAEKTGLSYQAADQLILMKDSPAMQNELHMVEDLLTKDPGALHFLAAAYCSYQGIRSCSELMEQGIAADDLITLPSGQTFLAVEADTQKDFALFRLNKALVSFAELQIER